MTNIQLYLAIGIPSLLVLIGLLLNLKQTKDTEDRLAARMDTLRVRIDGVEGSLGARIGGVESSLGSRLARVERSIEVIEHDLREFYKDLGKHDGRLLALEQRKS